MIRRMQKQGLATIGGDKRVQLTEYGLQVGEDMARRHRLAEWLVVRLIGMDLYRAHMEAHRLEHAISPELEEDIVAKLGNPKTCPFGHPVPGSGYSSPQDAVSIDQAVPGMELVVDRVPEDDQSLLEYMVANRLIPGEVVSVLEMATSRGVITLQCGGIQMAFSYEVASKIWARPRTAADA